MRLFMSMCVVVVVSSALPVRAQSLGDVAKKEEERRKDTKNALKTYTNKDLPEAPAPPSSDNGAIAPGAPVAAPAATAAPKVESRDTSGDADDRGKVTDKAKISDNTPEGPKDREQWQARMRALKEQLERNKTLADALQNRLYSLDADLINRDDPAQRARLTSERSRTVAELNRLRKAVEADAKAVPALEEEARRAGVPPGWLR